MKKRSDVIREGESLGEGRDKLRRKKVPQRYVENDE